MSQYGISVRLPQGWDGIIYQRSSGGGQYSRPVLHAATFALPGRRGDYGSGAVELMSDIDVLVALLDFGPEAASQPLFTTHPRPRSFGVRDFSAYALQRPLRGQAGVQRFFSENGSGFCLYVVLGSLLRAGPLVPAVNQVIQAVEISPRQP